MMADPANSMVSMAEMKPNLISLCFSVRLGAWPCKGLRGAMVISPLALTRAICAEAVMPTHKAACFLVSVVPQPLADAQISCHCSEVMIR